MDFRLKCNKLTMGLDMRLCEIKITPSKLLFLVSKKCALSTGSHADSPHSPHGFVLNFPLFFHFGSVVIFLNIMRLVLSHTRICL